MDENAIHQWLIECFGPVQGEMAWGQLSQLPEELRAQLMSQDSSRLPKPQDVQALMQAFSAGGLNTVDDMQRTVQQGPINAKLASSIALQQANGEGSQRTVAAQDAQAVRKAMSEANLWLDTACSFDPAPGEPEVLTRAGWVEGTLDSWAKFAAPVAQSMNNALSSVISERLGGAMDGEIAGIFAGPVPIPIPDGMKDPNQLIKLLGNTSYAMQLGHAAGELSHEVRGSFDQGIALLKNPAGALIAQNAFEYAESLDLDRGEVLAFLALQEVAHARLFADVPWLMPRFEALIGKYARGVDIDLDAMEEQLRDADTMDPEAISGAVNLSKVGIPDTPEQQEAMDGLETMLALVEGWVDCVTWKAGMAHIPHIEQLREMLRRERAVGGPAERTFESLMGLELRPKRMREAAAIWEGIEAEEGPDARDAAWSHPDLLPKLPAEGGTGESAAKDAGNTTHPAVAASHSDSSASSPVPAPQPSDGSIDWDAELNKLLDESQPEASGTDESDANADNANGTGENASSADSDDAAGDGSGKTAHGDSDDGADDDPSDGGAAA
ncbi:zinc-dependent metalloprotease [Bifidobacterium sp.]|uniref:zinc-dependent metalloprotease n=1 Tax=Bifidobacterium sp. TaxID=41200 RepID=UPI0025BE6B5E|nr:zinc-dependent metalloprotease [Bifidobacterium sp.]MCH4210090.1 zinc-dependent metalloprotease [Bifidobacterium sp.]MCI1225193.1 zinc-dependent metalloprotease [Bifidobacterium sp.]